MLARFQEWGVSFLTVLFFKTGTPSANTPNRFIDYLRDEYTQLLDPHWQQERRSEIGRHFPSDRVLFGQPGFTALATPHWLGDNATAPK